MLDNFYKNVCNEFGWIVQLDNTNLAPIIKKCFILFSLWWKKIALAIKETTLKQNMLRSKCLNHFLVPIFFNQFYW